MGLLWSAATHQLLRSVHYGSNYKTILLVCAGCFRIIDQPTDQERHGSEVLETVRDGLCVEDVSYAYPDGTPALNNINLNAQVGEMVALVGATGSGKTTLSYLVPAFIQPTEGRVLLDGIDTRKLAVANLRDLVSYVFQEPAVFDDTVASNIRLGNPEA